MQGQTPGEIMRELRGDRRREEVAIAAGVSAQAIAGYETDQHSPRDGVKQKIANYYGKTVQEIFFPNDGDFKSPERS